MQATRIIESGKDGEYCAICRKWKGGKFLILNVANKYIPICRKCEKRPLKKGWLRHIFKKGYSMRIVKKGDN